MLMLSAETSAGIGTEKSPAPLSTIRVRNGSGSMAASALLVRRRSPMLGIAISMKVT